jgi:hypothetical protein
MSSIILSGELAHHHIDHALAARRAATGQQRPLAGQNASQMLCFLAKD